MAKRQQEWTVTETQAGRIDRLIQQATKLTRSDIRGLIDHGCVTLNGQVCSKDFARIKAGDRVTLNHDPNQRYPEKPTPWHSPAFSIIYEDADLIVVDKAANVLTVPTGKNPSGTLVQAVETYLKQSKANRRRGLSDEQKKVHVVHRLDLGVSGLLVLAKSSWAKEQLKLQFAAHKPKRVYLAIVAGNVEPAEGTFDSFLATAENLDRYSTDDPEEGEQAITHYRTLKSFDGATLVQVKLETGKRNQIRVHFAEAGHPVLGDPRYRPDLAADRYWKTNRLALHAASLALAHPRSKKVMTWQSPLPEPMQKWVNAAKEIATPRSFPLRPKKQIKLEHPESPSLPSFDTTIKRRPPLSPLPPLPPLSTLPTLPTLPTLAHQPARTAKPARTARPTRPTPSLSPSSSSSAGSHQPHRSRKSKNKDQ